MRSSKAVLIRSLGETNGLLSISKDLPGFSMYEILNEKWLKRVTKSGFSNLGCR